MDDAGAHSFVGASCEATLDLQAQTLTLQHRGFGASALQKTLSPLVIPLGAITSVASEKRRFSGWFRVEVRGRQPWLREVGTDPFGLTCGDDPTEFAALVRSAVSAAEPLTAEQVEAALPDFEAAEDVAAKPSTGGKVAGGVAKALINGFFNSR